MPLTETRTYTVSCARSVVPECTGTARLQADHDQRELEGRAWSRTEALDLLRAAGWRLGQRDTCPRCWAAWEGDAEGEALEPGEVDQ